MSNTELEDKFHGYISTVYQFITLLKELYNEFPLEKFIELSNPNIEELEELIKNLKIAVDQFDIQDDLLLQNKKISLQQSLLTAEALIIAAKRKNKNDFERLGCEIKPVV